MQRTLRQQAHVVTLLHQPGDRMARNIDVDAVHEDRQWLTMQEWLQDWKTKWDDSHKNNVLCGTYITAIIVEVVANKTTGTAAVAQDQRKTDRDKTARLDGSDLTTTRHDAGWRAREALAAVTTKTHTQTGTQTAA